MLIVRYWKCRYDSHFLLCVAVDDFLTFDLLVLALQGGPVRLYLLVVSGGKFIPTSASVVVHPCGSSRMRAYSVGSTLVILLRMSSSRRTRRKRVVPVGFPSKVGLSIAKRQVFRLSKSKDVVARLRNYIFRVFGSWRLIHSQTVCHRYTFPCLLLGLLRFLGESCCHCYRCRPLHEVWHEPHCCSFLIGLIITCHFKC